MSENRSNEDARREAARKRLHERQARENDGAADVGTRRRTTSPAGRPGSTATPRSSRARSNTHGERAEGLAPDANKRQRRSGQQRVTRQQAVDRNTVGTGTPETDATPGTVHDNVGSVRTQPTTDTPRPRVKRTDVRGGGAGNRARSAGSRRSRAAATQTSGNASGGIAGMLKNIGGKIAAALATLCAAIKDAFLSLCGKFGKRNVLIGLGIVVVLLVVLIVAVRACTAPVDDSKAALIEANKAVSSSSYSNDDGTTPNEDTLVKLLGSDDAAKLLQTASTDSNVYWIASHPEQFATDGDAVQTKLLKLAANEPAASAFLYNWPSQYPASEPNRVNADLPSEDGSQTNVPRLYQWDYRWGYTVYSSTTFALTGCCPTSMAMVYQGLTGNTDITPYDMGALATQGGYESTYNGTDASFLSYAADQLGLTCTELSPAASNLTAPLSAGQVVIVNVGPGDFTTSGHYIVACGLDSDGKVIVNDPYSSVRSNQTWDVDTLVSQAKMFYAFSVA
jgi:hypothetical protein